jgi:hypothetical protein
MNRSRSFLRTAASVACAVLLSAVLAAPASAAESLANVSTDQFTTYCQAHGYPAGAKLFAQNAYGWGCVGPNNEKVNLSVTAVCREVTVKNNQPTVLDFLSDYTRVDDYGWFCYRLSRVAPLGRLNVNRYCADRNYDVITHGKNVLSWRCQSGGVNLEVNNVQTLSNMCAEVYPSSEGTVVARVVDFNNLNGVECMV